MWERAVRGAEREGVWLGAGWVGGARRRGPILFVVFCNDAPSCISSTCLMYADDMKLARRIRSPDDAVALQTDLDILSAWSTVWKLKLNPAKCKVITFTLRKKPVMTSYSINNSTLDRVSEMRDLGVVLDTKLTFASHIDDVVGRANRAMRTFLRSLQTSRTGGSRGGGQYGHGPSQNLRRGGQHVFWPPQNSWNWYEHQPRLVRTHLLYVCNGNLSTYFHQINVIHKLFVR